MTTTLHLQKEVRWTLQGHRAQLENKSGKRNVATSGGRLRRQHKTASSLLPVCTDSDKAKVRGGVVNTWKGSRGRPATSEIPLFRKSAHYH